MSLPDIDTINKYRVFELASQELRPMLEEMHADAYTRLLGAFRDGSKELLPFVARCAAFQDIIDDIEAKTELYARNINNEQRK